MIEIQVKINSTEEALRIVKEADKLDNDVDFMNGRVMVDAKSVIGVLSSDFSKPCKIVLLAERSDPGVETFIQTIQDNILKMEDTKR
ncbi:HPr family phosphocarrier protein [Enterocloster aldenensis]|uniref:HPr family phosphocarrier protein n=1 Tax=Enterocloster aldenensis TaxID=358742 RepID=UPI000E4E2D9B|nr:HPr family phosphocarrier protein [Enterocloster aldenensis]